MGLGLMGKPGRGWVGAWVDAWRGAWVVAVVMWIMMWWGWEKWMFILGMLNTGFGMVARGIVARYDMISTDVHVSTCATIYHSGSVLKATLEATNL